MLGGPVEGYNHTSAAINRFTVNGAGGPNIGPYQGGGKHVCCGVLPRHWRPGLRAIVEWENNPNPGASVGWPSHGTDGWREAYKKHAANFTHHRIVVEIAQYDSSGPLIVHFLPCDMVRVAATPIVPRNQATPTTFPARWRIRHVPNPEPAARSQPDKPIPIRWLVAGAITGQRLHGQGVRNARCSCRGL